MTITYEMGNNLYVNLTNRCSNSCDFCIRNVEDSFSVDLWLEREPSLSEILDDIFKRDLKKYSQLVFCGFGEPLERLEDILAVAREVKKKADLKIRINTNGQANIIHKRDVTPEFKSLVDCLSISLNARNAEEYDAICHSVYGKEAFSALLDFTKRAKEYVKDVQLSVVDCMPLSHIEECRKIADSIGVKLRVRSQVK